MKRISMFLLLGVLLLTTRITALANDSDIETGEKEVSVFTDQLKENIVETIRETPREQRDSALEELLSENICFTNRNNKESTTILTEEDFVKYENVEIEEAVVDEIVFIDDETYVEFYTSGIFVVNSCYMVDAETDNQISTLATTSYTATRRSEADAYNVFGGIVVAVWAEGYFSYDGVNAPTPYLMECNYEKYGILNAWGVENWTSGTPRNLSNKTAKFYASGTFYWGLTVEGNGIKIQTYPVTVGFFCNKSGDMTSIKVDFP